MQVRDLVVGRAPQGTTDAPVFVTPQSIATFPVATLAVSVIYRVLGVLVPAWANNLGVGVVVAFIIGLLIYVLSVNWMTDTVEQKIKALIVAAINCFFLAAAALGLFDVLSSVAPK